MFENCAYDATGAQDLAGYSLNRRCKSASQVCSRTITLAQSKALFGVQGD